MAIADRNLTPGTKLWAKYKGQTHSAEVIALHPGSTGTVLPSEEARKAELRDRLLNAAVARFEDRVDCDPLVLRAAARYAGLQLEPELPTRE